MRATLSALILTLIALAVAAAEPVDRAGVLLPRHFEAEGTFLELAACGVRDPLWIDLYVASLYVPQRQDAERAVRDPNSAKLVRLDILRTLLMPERIPEEYRTPLREELAPHPYSVLAQYYRDLRPGDVVSVLYRPGAGVALRVNGRTVVTEPGHRLIDRILQTWSAPREVSGKLQDMLARYAC